MTLNRRFALILSALALVGVTGCPMNPVSPTTGQGIVAVDTSDTTCNVSEATAPSGTIGFAVKNNGKEVAGFQLLDADGVRVVGQLENIEPGQTDDLELAVEPGEYFTVCKPGMVGEGIRAPFTVTDSESPRTPNI